MKFYKYILAICLVCSTVQAQDTMSSITRYDLELKVKALQNRVEELQRDKELNTSCLQYRKQQRTMVQGREKQEGELATKKAKLIASLRSGNFTIRKWKLLLQPNNRSVTKRKLIELVGSPDRTRGPTDTTGFLNEKLTYRDLVLVEGGGYKADLVVSIGDGVITYVSSKRN